MARAKLFSIIMVLIMIAGQVGPLGMVGGQGFARAHPLLTQLAAKQPDQLVAVIVQKLAKDTHLEKRVAQLGGMVTRDLSIINAFAAQMEAQDALALSLDAGVRWVSLDAPVERTGKPSRSTNTTESSGGSTPVNTYLNTLRVSEVWNMGLKGRGITVAVIDSGVTTVKDLQVDPTKAKPDSRLIEQLTFNYNATANGDVTGHGTHVAGIIGGSGYLSNYIYPGIAPEVSLISLRVSDDSGMAYESDVVEALQWVYDHKSSYNIRVINMSINSTVESSYHTSPLSAAAEILWFNGVVVVVSAGNYGGNTSFNPVRAAPAHDPFLITVGATSENGTANRSDDAIGSFSSYGTTLDGHSKPDIYAPGKNIISIFTNSGQWASLYPDRVVATNYFRLSGTSMAAPMVAGAAALLLQDEPNLTPDQVKYRLLNTAGWIGNQRYLDVYAAVTGSTTQNANTGLTASQLLWSGSDPVTWGSVAWNSVAWNSVAWNSVAWNSVAWNSVAWNSVAWND
ncbi:MAG: S8 family serine peptidase [Anaerolineales bacterium]|nr:MAG: S8 family serine peptidase [Anaerolineales bacterium]